MPDPKTLEQLRAAYAATDENLPRGLMDLTKLYFASEL